MVSVRKVKRQAKKRLEDLIEKGEELFSVRRSKRAPRRAAASKMASTRVKRKQKAAARKAAPKSRTKGKKTRSRR
jgi:hypothetical protein